MRNATLRKNLWNLVPSLQGPQSAFFQEGDNSCHFFKSEKKLRLRLKHIQSWLKHSKWHVFSKWFKCRGANAPSVQPIWRPCFTDVNIRKILESGIRYSIYCFYIHWVYIYIRAQTLLIFIIYYWAEIISLELNQVES